MLKEKKEKMTKLRFIDTSFKQQQYITETIPSTTKNIMWLRLNMTKLNANYKGTNRNIECKACGKEPETTEHIFVCKKYTNMFRYNVKEDVIKKSNGMRLERAAEYVKEIEKYKEEVE